ncbi:MAG: calycin-like domain-containing protein [Prevotellaceae bacterium]|nr:calycin-like domain-containing protein [Prevotellaceae bacterium]
MKKILKNFISLSLGLLLVAAGCSKDDNYAKDIEGAYAGSVSLSALQLVVPDVTITVAVKNNNTAIFSLNMTIPSLPNVGDLPLNVSCETTITKSGDDYTVSGTTSVSLPGAGGLPVTLSGTITAGGEANLTIGLSMGIPLTAIFSGAKK